MKLVDRIAAWLGYVPAERLAELTRRPVWWNAPTPEYAWLDEDTRTIVKTPPQVLISTDFKRGIPCS